MRRLATFVGVGLVLCAALLLVGVTGLEVATRGVRPQPELFRREGPRKMAVGTSDLFGGVMLYRGDDLGPTAPGYYQVTEIHYWLGRGVEYDRIRGFNPGTPPVLASDSRTIRISYRLIQLVLLGLMAAPLAFPPVRRQFAAGARFVLQLLRPRRRGFPLDGGPHSPVLV